LQWIKPLNKGQEAERLAQQFLEQQGLSCVTTNYRCKTGEIDLVMRQDDLLVFVEVKYRTNSSHGSPIELFHKSKRQKFESAVKHYLFTKGLNPSIVAHRIDLVGIEMDNHGHSQINWLQAV
jgi:putative endonuclease